MRAGRTALLLVLAAVSCRPFEPSAEAGETFGVCCAGFGTCVPRGLVPPELAPHLARAECGEALLCAPEVAVTDAAYRPALCVANGGGAGRCLLACLPEVASVAALLVQSTCELGELCVPCVAGVPCL